MESNLCYCLPNETPIDSLFQQGLLSVRAYNTCRRTDIHTVGDLLSSHRKDTDWMHIYRCGTKTAFELTTLISRLRKSPAA